MHRPLVGLMTSLLLCACGGGDENGTSPAATNPTPTPPTSSPPPADTTAPTVSVTATVATDAVSFLANATDNVGVTSVNFLIDDSAIQGTVQKSPSDGSYSLQIPSNSLSVGNHSVSAVASDAAGNTATSTAVAFTVGNRVTTQPDTTPPTVTAAVEGNFGLVKLTAIAKDNVRIDTVDFVVDGVATGFRASPAYVATDSADQYFWLFDTTGLSTGTHSLLARATDTSGNVTNSASVAFNVDAAAGQTEVEPNNSVANATVVAPGQSQLAGTLVTVTSTAGTTKVVKPDLDYYQLSLAAGKTVSINMLSTLGFFLTVEDANGTTLSNASTTVSSDVSNVSYTNGSVPQNVYIRVTSIPYDFKTHNQYRLSLSY